VAEKALDFLEDHGIDAKVELGAPRNRGAELKDSWVPSTRDGKISVH